MGADEIEELALRYRSATTDLAAAQSRAYSEPTRAYLNRLTARAHAYVYAESASNGWARLVEFFGSTFPVEVRRSAAVIGGCTAVFVIAAVIAYGLVAERPLNVYALLPASMVPIVDKSLHDSNFAFDRAYAPEMASEIITNNVKVAMIAFAGGMTLGVVTFLSILQNGLMVGGLGALFAAKGFGLDFWATVAPHGVIELTSIQISAGAGLLLAQAIVAPGRMRRIDALKANARRAGVLMIGVAGLLCVAGTIEGFISPQRTSIAFRIAFGALTALLLTAYLGLAGRKRAVALALCLAVALALCLGLAALLPGAARADELTIHVDTPTVFASLLNKIALAYRAVNPSVTVVIRERTYGDALHDLDTAAADIAILDRGPGGPPYVDRPVAIVPYAFVADPRIGVTSLTTAQITAIWSGRITNWSQAGGAALPAVLVQRPANSGTTGLFASLFGAATPSAMVVDNNSAAVVAAVRDNRGAIGYVGLAYASLDGVRTLGIDGSQPDADGIASGKYRFYTTIHAVGSAPPSPIVSRFLSFAESRREMLHDAGFLTIFETKPR